MCACRLARARYLLVAKESAFRLVVWETPTLGTTNTTPFLMRSLDSPTTPRIPVSAKLTHYYQIPPSAPPLAALNPCTGRNHAYAMTTAVGERESNRSRTRGQGRIRWRKMGGGSRKRTRRIAVWAIHPRPIPRTRTTPHHHHERTAYAPITRPDCTNFSSVGSTTVRAMAFRNHNHHTTGLRGWIWGWMKMKVGWVQGWALDGRKGTEMTADGKSSGNGHTPTQQVFPSTESSSNSTSTSTPDAAQQVHLRTRVAHSNPESQTPKPRTTPRNSAAAGNSYFESAWLSAGTMRT
ncbi:hypothetical protein FIBSPDRAFT_104439 [Athelia psychrophila]|uniref:Uncharacterized protein n=1 Tax=Athelia psychrophila TaxID=1759441 RepID=A0A166DDZ4_9AGAM|nr:hypothetical protein FIBSPDRAFT_104439 [Fibularhizoctonia sp. CBS 109695]